MGRFPALTGLFLLCLTAWNGTAWAQDGTAANPFPPEIRAPDQAETRSIEAAWQTIQFHDASAFPQNTIDAIAKIRPLVEVTYGPDHPLALRLDTLEANSLAKIGKHAEAEAIFAGNTPALDRRMGPDKDFAYSARDMRASNLVQLGRLAEAAAIFEDNARLVAAEPSLTPVQRGRLSLSLAYLRRMQGRFAEAEQLTRAALEAERAADAPQPQFEAAEVASLARALAGLGRAGEASNLLKGELDGYLAQDSARARLLFAKGDVSSVAGRLLDAQAAYDAAAKLAMETDGYYSPNTAQATARKRATSLDLLGASPAIVTAMVFDGLPLPGEVTQCPQSIATLSDVESALTSTRMLIRGTDRRDCLARIRAFLEAGMGADAPLTLDVREQLASTLDGIGDSEPALEEARTLVASRERVNGANHPATARAELLYARALASLGQVSEARTYEQRAAAVLPGEAFALEAARLDTLGDHAEAELAWAKAETAFDAGPKQSLKLAIDIIAGKVFNALYQGRCAEAARKDLDEMLAVPNYELIGDIRRPSDEAHAILLACEGRWDEASEIYGRLAFESVSDAIVFQDANLARLQARRALALKGSMENFDTAWRAASEAVFYARERRYTPDRDAEGKPLGYRRGGAAAGADPLAIAFAAMIAVDWAYEGKTVTAGTYSYQFVGIDEAFRAAQDFAQSSAAAALLEAAARAAVTDPELAALIDRQAALAARIAEAPDAGEVDRQVLAALTDELRRRFPAYANTARPFGLSIEETRKRLKPGEALLMIQPVGEDVYSFAISAETFAWNRATLKRSEMDTLVERVRCRIDIDSCRLKLEGLHLFEGPAAAALYRELVAPVERGLGGAETVFAVTGGSLGAIPLGILVTGDAPVQDGDEQSELASLAKTRWLGDAYALATLPSVSSLRAYAAASENLSGSAFVGVGDPVLGPPLDVERGGPSSRSTVARGGDGLVEIGALKALHSLPGTRRELLAIAAALGTPQDRLLLGTSAREEAVKASADIAAARIVAFATHALLPGEIEGSAEPGLVLTPPGRPSSADDGYLSASEVAALKLDAQWVVLSACNTAGPADGASGESLSGLARAFFFAGARSLLVSHWPVLDSVGAAITTETFRIAAARPQASRAEALRLALRGIRSGQSELGGAIPGWQPAWADPWAWAPFSLIETGT